MPPVPMRLLTALGAVLILLGALSTPALAGPAGGRHFCEARDGVVLIQRGSATCRSGEIGSNSYAIATGKNASAIASSGGVAVANGDSSSALAHVGYANATGRESNARAVDLDSYALAEGNRSQATAISGGAAEAYGTQSYAHAGGTGSQAYAEGTRSSATAFDGCSVTSGPGETLSCP